MKKVITLVLLIAALALWAKAESYNYNFEDPNEPNLILSHYGERARTDLTGPEVKGGILLLNNGGYFQNQKNAALFPETPKKLYADIQLNWKMYITPGAEGMGVALLDSEVFKADSLNLDIEAWQAPSLENSFGLGFDIHNPPTSAWFDENGNFYDRPQREISLHWDGMEIVKIMSPVEFRADQESDEDLLDYQLNIHYLVGGAEVSLSINEELVYDSYFIAEMQPYKPRLALGAQTAKLTTTVYIDELELKYENIVKPAKQPVQVTLIDQQPIFIDYRDTEFEIDFPEFKDEIGRIILTLELSTLPGGFDPWDKGAAIYVYEDSVRYELCRFITPYHRGYVWKVDVTDFMPLLKGKKKITMHVDTWQKKEENFEDQIGWYADVDLDFYPGAIGRKPVKVQNLWIGNEEYGNQEKPLSDFFVQQQVTMPEGANDAKLRLVVTGHGMSPNDKNAGEFMPSDRSVFVNRREFKNRLWKTDCYLNPCRPQGGTWKFDRTGWAPGSVVEAWEINLKDIVQTERELNIDYLPMAYRNTAEGDHWKPHHWIECQIIYYEQNLILDSALTNPEGVFSIYFPCTKQRLSFIMNPAPSVTAELS